MNAFARVVASELRKLQRPGMVYGGLGTMVGLALLFGSLLAYVAGADPATPSSSSPQQPTVSLSGPEGLVLALGLLAGLLGTVSLVLCAQGMGGEYGHGTLKVLLTREPRRTLLLAGKTAAMAVFLLAGVLLAAVAQALAAGLVSSAQGVDISAWWTGEAFGEAGLTVLRTWLSCIVWGLLGTVLALALRSAPAAIGIGLGYTMVLESLIGFVASINEWTWPKWLPGSVLASFAQGGSTPTTQGPLALQLAPASFALAAYAVAFAAASALLIHRRDVAG